MGSAVRISKRKMKYLLEKGVDSHDRHGDENASVPYQIRGRTGIQTADEDGTGMPVRADRNVQYQRSAKENAAAARTDGGKLLGIQGVSCSGVGGTAGRAPGTAGGQADRCAAAANPQACPRGEAARRHHNGQTILRQGRIHLLCRLTREDSEAHRQCI